MGIRDLIFGKRPKDEPDLTEHLEVLNTFTASAIAVMRSDGTPFSRLGGLPCLPPEIAWPEWRGQPLAFLAQFDLSEIPENCDRHGLPTTGLLYFFYDQDQLTRGFDPKDIGSWRVLYTESEVNDCMDRGAPEGLIAECIYQAKPIKFDAIQTYPDAQDPRIEALGLNDLQFDQYCDRRDSVYPEGQPAHQLFGHSSPIQTNAMDLECQLASNGLYCGDSSGYKDPRAKDLEPGRKDWLLLFQLDSDDDANMMWGDVGRLYFWIRKQDLRSFRFDQCWMILQCY